MEIYELLMRMGGVASWRQLVVESSEAEVRAAAAGGRIVRIRRGLYALPSVEEAVQAARALTGVLSLTSAAMHHGWAVKIPPAHPHVTVPRKRHASWQRRQGVQLHYGEVVADGIVTSPVQTVIDCARGLPFDEALCVADSALRSGMIGPLELIAAAEQSPRTGQSDALRVATAADGGADNPFESVTRAISKEFSELNLVPQVVVPSVGRPDLVDEGLRLIVECDSFRFHSDRAAVVRDVERYNACALHGHFLLRFAWEHAMLRQDYVRHTFRQWLEAQAVTQRQAVRPPCPGCAA